MSAVILSDSYDALTDSIRGKLDITDLTVHLLFLSFILHFDGKQLRVLNHLVEETI